MSRIYWTFQKVSTLSLKHSISLCAFFFGSLINPRTSFKHLNLKCLDFDLLTFAHCEKNHKICVNISMKLNENVLTFDYIFAENSLAITNI